MATYVLMAGLPGTGKSTVAQALATALGGILLSKDILRAAIFPGPLTDYTREQDDLCFTLLLEAVNYLAAHSRAEFIFLDGRTFSRREQIEQVIQAAQAAGCNWKILHTACPNEVAEARLMQGAAKHPATNRTIELYREIKARFEPITLPQIDLDTSQPLELCLRQAMRYLRQPALPIE